MSTLLRDVDMAPGERMIMPNESRDDFDVVSPWRLIGPFGRQLEQELLKELGGSHVLYGCKVTAIAQRADCDDVLFRVDGHEHPYAVIHLTWSGRQENNHACPDAQFFASIDDWKSRCMEPDHEEFCGKD